MVARGSGTGLSGRPSPAPTGILVSFERMNRILEIDIDNHVAVVQPGVTLEELDAGARPRTASSTRCSPASRAPRSAGNVATNAGGMRAVKYGVTRHHVLGLEAVLANGEVHPDRGQVREVLDRLRPHPAARSARRARWPWSTEATLKLHPRLGPRGHRARPLRHPRRGDPGGAPDRRQRDRPAHPRVRRHGHDGRHHRQRRPRPRDPRRRPAGALAYLVVVLESTDADRLDEDVERLGELLEELGALDVYVLPDQAGAQLIAARERAFFVAKAAGADDIVDVVVPRAVDPGLPGRGRRPGRSEHGALVTGCGHVGDGNVHLSVFQPDPSARHAAAARPSSAPASSSAVPSRASTASARRSGRTSSSSRTRSSWPSCDASRRAFDPHGILEPGHLLELTRVGSGP